MHRTIPTSAYRKSTHRKPRAEAGSVSGERPAICPASPFFPDFLRNLICQIVAIVTVLTDTLVGTEVRRSNFFLTIQYVVLYTLRPGVHPYIRRAVAGGYLFFLLLISTTCLAGILGGRVVRVVDGDKGLIVATFRWRH